LASRYGTWTRALALGVASLLGVFAVEVGMRALYALSAEAPPHLDRSLVSEWRWAQSRLAGKGRRIDANFAFHPALGWTHRASLQGPTPTNSAGMRGTREFTEARVHGVPRLVVVGDSYAASYGVPESAAFHTVLARDYLPGWEVINLGVSGYGPDQATLMYETTGARYRPDVAVLAFFVHGHFRNNERFRSYAKPYFTLDESGALVLHDEHLLPPDALLEEYRSGARRIGGWTHSYAWAALRRELRLPFALRTIDPEDPEWRLTAALLRRFVESARASGAKPLLLVIPASPGRHEDRLYAEIDRLARDEARSLGVPFVALADTFHAVPDATRAEPLFGDDEVGGHFTAAGYREMARLLAEAVLPLSTPEDQAIAQEGTR
jgi:hypothetical protein